MIILTQHDFEHLHIESYDCKNSPILVILIKYFYMIQLIKICQPTTKRSCVIRIRLFGTHIYLNVFLSH